MKKRLAVLLATFIIILSFCACGNNDNGNIGKDGTLTDDVKGIMDDGDLDMNDNTNNGKRNCKRHNRKHDRRCNKIKNIVLTGIEITEHICLFTNVLCDFYLL